MSRRGNTIENTISPIDVAALEATEVGQRVALICKSADALKAENITVLDVRGQTIIADYFVICSGTSTTHIHSIAGHVVDEMRAQGFRTRAEGQAASCWIVLDYGDAIMHVLNEEMREFYDLERLWADAKISHWSAQQPAS